ncbi:sensor histidine kinase [Cryobacterium algoricola]|uniref:histidine kinase n=1 Tax=Cryobacterium algoricola TaxID=1259183 RepID=A0ABY2IAF1_9MICO|nr:histidine kinase [Cryobacterium algoricola]TFB84124.1 sensor histidine kinase [Cryobacterium algoricola]
MIRHLSRQQLTVDAAIAVVLFLARSVLGFDTVVVFWVAVGMAVALFMRRLSPALALGIAWCTVAVQLASMSLPDIANAAILPVLYATGAYGPRIICWLGLASVPVGAAVATVYVLVMASGGLDNLAGLVLQVRTGEAFQAGAPGVVGFTSALALFGLSWALGLLASTWGNARASRAALLAAEAEQAAALREVAVEQERTRIARDMHDVVAHSLAVVIAQADGGRYARATNPEAADEAFRTIATTAREALGDVRVLLRQLRSHETAGPQPTLDDLDRLVDQLRTSGLTIERAETGPPVRLGSGQQLAIYRVVQESLTNVLRHGDRSELVTIRFAWAETALELTVASGLRSPRTSVSGPPGHGIDGMRERAMLAGGTFDAGVQGNRFVVRVSLPVLAGGVTLA